MRKLNLIPHPHPHLRTCIALALAVATASFPACRLGANNSEKLTALKSGEIYDEDGILSVEIASPETATIISLASNSTAYSVSGTCTPDGVAISLAIDGADLAVSAPCAGGSWSSTFDSTALGDGDHTLVATTFKGGKTKSSKSVSFTKNTQLPSLAITSPSIGAFINASTDSATFALAGTCSEADQTVAVQVDGASATAQNGGSCNGATWAATISTLGLSAGAHTLQVSLTSAVGNLKSSDPVVVTKDITVPTASISAPAASSYVNLGNNSASFAVTGACNDSSATVQVKVDGSNSGSAAACSGTAWNTTISTVALAQGAHTLAAQITDTAGNSATSATVAITKDTAAPSVGISAPAANSYVNLGNNSATFAINGTCTTATENGRTVTIQIDGANATQSAISCGASDAWSGTFSSVPLSQGAHTLTAVLADAAGNSTTSATVAITKDTSAPTVTLTRPIAGVTINATTNSATYPVQGTCSENSRAVSILVDGSAAASVASNTCSSGAFSATIDVTGLSNAAHTLTATQSDVAGNTGPSSPPSASVTKDVALAQGATFGRTSVGLDPYTFVQAASGVGRFSSVGGATGIVIEEATTNLWNNPSLETNTNSWFALGATQPVRVTTDAVHGSASVDFENGVMYHTIAGMAASTKYTFSGWFKAVPGDENKTVQVQIRDNTNNLYIGQTTVTLTSSWQKVIITGTTGASTPSQMEMYVRNGTAGRARVDAVQLERKDYATSFVSSGSRSAEGLSLPSTGSIQTSQGAAVIRAYVDGDVAANPSKSYHYLFFYGQSTSNNFILLRRNPSAQYTAAIIGPSGSATEVFCTQTPSTGWHTFGMKWSATSIGIWIDGTPCNTASSVHQAPNTGLNISIGSDYIPIYQWDSVIDYAAFYQHAPSDAQMITYTSTGPTGADNRLDFSGGTFARTSLANDSVTGALAASGAARFSTIGGSTGLHIESGTTNLLAAGSQNFTTTTWTAYNGATATTTAGQSDPFGGSSAVRIQTSGGANGTKYYISALCPSVNATKYATQVWIKVNSATNVTITDNITTSTTYTQAQGWQKFQSLATGNGASCLQIAFNAPTVGDSLDFTVMNPIQEAKVHATSYVAPGATRSAETFEFPVSTDNMSLAQGAIVLRVYVDGDLAANPSAANHYLLDNQSLSGGWDGFYFRRASGTNTWYAQIASSQASGLYQTPSCTQQLSVGWHHFGLRWDSTRFGIWIDGSECGGVNAPPLPTAFLNTFKLGTDRGKNNQADALFDYVAIYKTVPTTTEMSAYTSTGPVNADFRLDFNSSLGQ